jgi:hypothetical protein
MLIEQRLQFLAVGKGELGEVGTGDPRAQMGIEPLQLDVALLRLSTQRSTPRAGGVSSRSPP